MPNNNFNMPLRINTGKLNTVNDAGIGTVLDPTTVSGAQAMPGLLGRVVKFDKATIAKKWDTSLSAAPATSDVVFQYVLVASDNPVDQARGVLAFWKDKDAFTVTSDDTADYDPAGVFLGAKPADGKYGFIAVAGEVAVKVKSSTTKATPDVGDRVVTTSGDSGLADVKADATAQTYGTDNSNKHIGILQVAVATQIGIVALDVMRNGW